MPYWNSRTTRKREKKLLNSMKVRSVPSYYCPLKTFLAICSAFIILPLLGFPVETKQCGVQTESMTQLLGGINEVEGYDGTCFMKVNKMEDFICRSTSHAAKCLSPLVLIQRRVLFCGTMLCETWKCLRCGEDLVFENQDMVRSDEVAEGARFSRLQPMINLEIVKGSKLERIPHEQMLGLFWCMGIYVGKNANVLKQATKVKAAIKHTFEERLIENQKEHVTMTRANNNYCGDIKWEKDGRQQSSCCSEICIDGAGCTRSYNHRHRGKQSAFVVNSRISGKPLALVVSKVSNDLLL
jgi:hypothetical protein